MNTVMFDKVLCLVETQKDINLDVIWDQENWIDKKNLPVFPEKIMPLINHPHNDIENGQREVHYHADMRYIDFTKSHLYHNDTRINLPLKKDQRLEWRMLKIIDKNRHYVTPVNLIAKSKLKHKCIHKGKCPHRGYDLTNVKPRHGVITCPLHGLEFDESGKLIKK